MGDGEGGSNMRENGGRDRRGMIRKLDRQEGGDIMIL